MSADETDSGPGNLSYEEKEHLVHLLEVIKGIGLGQLKFVDPKFYGLLEIAFELLCEQVAFDKKYEVDMRPIADEDRFNTDNDTPSLEDMDKWFK